MKNPELRILTTPIPTRTLETCEDYRKLAEQLLKRSAAACSDASIGQVPALIDWLEQNAGEWGPATRRRYRAALAYWFTEAQKQDSENSSEARKEIAQLVEFLQGHFMWIAHRRVPAKTSAKKQKFMTEEQRDLLLSVLAENCRSQYAMPLAAFILAGEGTGLRRDEWTQALFMQQDGVPHIVTKNLKTTNGRGSGEWRIQNLSGLSKVARDSAQQLVATFQSHAPEERRVIISGMRKLLYRTCKALWPDTEQTIALYTLRHQYSANAKANDFSSLKLAASMGHASPETAKEHYGRRRNGRRGLLNESTADNDLVGIAEPSIQDCLSLKESLDRRQADGTKPAGAVAGQTEVPLPGDRLGQEGTEPGDDKGMEP